MAGILYTFVFTSLLFGRFSSRYFCTSSNVKYLLYLFYTFNPYKSINGNYFINDTPNLPQSEIILKVFLISPISSSAFKNPQK